MTLRAAVAHARLLDDELDGGGDLLPHGALRQVRRAHRDHGFDTRQRVARAVGVDRRQRAVVAGVHRLQHVERFLASNLADDDAVGAHTQGVDDELPLPDRALAFDVRRPRLEPRHMLLVELQLGGVLDRHDALALGDERRHDVEQRRLPGAGTAADQNVQARTDAVLDEIEHRLRDGAQVDEIRPLQPLGRKAPDREQRAVHRERRDDRVDARAVRQARVDHRRAVVDAPADRRHDAVDHAHQVLVVLEAGRDPLELAGPLDVDLLERVDQDVVDGRVAQQRLERPEAEHLVDDVAKDRLALRHAERRAFLGDQLEEQRPDLALRARAVGGRERLEVQPVQQLLVNRGLQLDILRAQLRLGLGPMRRIRRCRICHRLPSRA